jgi:hypothetical protein
MPPISPVVISVPEIQTLAETISTWRAEIARAVLTGHSNEWVSHCTSS